MKRPRRAFDTVVAATLLSASLATAPLRAAEPPASERVLRSYDLESLIDEIPQFPVGSWPTAGNLRLGGDRGAADSGFAGIFFGDDAEAVAGAGFPAEAIVEIVRRNIAEDSWSDSRNRIARSGSELIVVQTPAVQNRIAELLESLRARRARMVTVDVAVVPPDALGDLDQHSSLSLEDGVFDAALERAGERARRISITAYNDQAVSTFSGRYRSTVDDEELNATGVTPTINPWVTRLALGLTVEARPRVIEGTDWVSLDLHVTRLTADGEPEKRQTVFSEIELVPLAEETFEARLLLESSRAALAGTFRDTGDAANAREFAVLARARPVGVQPSPREAREAGLEHELRVYDVRFLVERTIDGAPALLDGNLLAELVRTNVDPDAWRDERASVRADSALLLATAPPGTHDRIGAWLSEQIRRRSRLGVVEVREFEGPLETVLDLGEQADDERALPRGWHEGREARPLRQVFHGIARGALSNRIVARGYRARSFVADLEVVSGGTGYAILHMPDATVDSAGTGFECEATLRGVSTDRLLLDLSLHRCSARFGRSGPFVASVELTDAARPDGRDDSSPSPAATRAAWIPYAIDLVDQDTRSSLGRSVLPAGRDVVLEIRETAGGNARLVVANVAAIELPAAAGETAPASERRRMRLYDLESITSEPAVVQGPLPAPPGMRGEVLGVRGGILGGSTGVSFEDPESAGLGKIKDLVAELIEPGSWSNDRNSIDGDAERLVVVQKPEVLERIDGFIGELERTVNRRLHLELALVPASVVEGVVPGWSRPGRPPWLEGPVLDRVVRAAGERARYFSVLARDGSRTVLAPASGSSRILDHDVNQTGALPVLGPVVRVFPEGSFADITVHLSSTETWVRADVDLGAIAAPRRLSEIRRLPRGEIELLRTVQKRLQTVVAGPLESAIVLGSVALPGVADAPRDAAPESFTGLLRVRALDAPAPPQPPEGLSLLRCGFLTAPLREPLFPGVPMYDESANGIERAFATSAGDEATRSLVAPEFLRALLARAVGSGQASALRMADSGRLLFVTGEDATASASRVLAALSAEKARPVTIDIWEGAIDAERWKALDSARAVLDDKWLDRFAGARGARTRASSLSGAVVSLASIASQGYVHDLERVSGGTGQRIIEVADISVRSVGEGLSLKVMATLVPGSPSARLRIQGELAQKPSLDRTVRMRESQVVELPLGEAGGARPTGEWIAIDLPEESTARWEHFVTVPLGRPVLLNALPDRERPGTARVLIAVVNAFGLEGTEGEERR